METNILVIGIDEFNMSVLSALNPQQYRFIPVFNAPEIRRSDRIYIDKLIEKAKRSVEELNRLDAIISFFDFPFTLIASHLIDHYGLRGPMPISAIKCQHKYWSRVEQQKVVPEHVPDFAPVNPYDTPGLGEINVELPFWLKPIKAHSSESSFLIKSNEDLQRSYPHIQDHIPHFAEPFNFFLDSIELPPDIRGVDGHYCIAEQDVQGHQCTLSGYVYEQDVQCYGIVDSIHYKDVPSFFYYYLPSALPDSVQQSMREISKTVMQHMGLNNSPFNIEFFYDKDRGAIHILEINPRMSQSHADLYHKVDGMSNHQVLIDVVLGKKPSIQDKQGKYNCAAKFIIRVFEDGVVRHVPSEQKIREIEHRYPDTHIQIDVQEGQRLSDLKLQDSYSYGLGIVYTGAQNRGELLQKYNDIKNELNLKIE